MNTIPLPGDARDEPDGLRAMSLDELAGDAEAARIVARWTRTEEREPVRVARFNSFI